MSIQALKQIETSARQVVEQLEQHQRDAGEGAVKWFKEILQLHVAIAAFAEAHASTLATIESLTARVKALESALQQREATAKLSAFRRVLFRIRN